MIKMTKKIFLIVVIYLKCFAQIKAMGNDLPLGAYTMNSKDWFVASVPSAF